MAQGRTLQRGLAARGTSHLVLVDETRHEQAARLLEDRSLSIGAISDALGFSEPSAFHRSFKRWTGTTPGEARRAAIEHRVGDKKYRDG